jgi:hypothetical protein
MPHRVNLIRKTYRLLNIILPLFRDPSLAQFKDGIVLTGIGMLG